MTMPDWIALRWLEKIIEEMNHTMTCSKCRVLHFNRKLEKTEGEQLRCRLLEAGLEGMECEEDTCTVRYSFPDTTLSMILELLGAPGPGLTLKPVTGLYDAVVMYLEDNERSQLRHAGGWKHNVEDIYFRYFEPYNFDRENLRRQTWRKYKER